jgi:phage terminase small subunit
MMKLTGKQRLFVENYLATGNATQAAIGAGYSARTARSIASENLKKPAIAAAIAKGRAKRRKRLNALADETQQALLAIVQADMADMYKAGTWTVLPPHEWPKALAMTVREVKQTVSRNGTRRIRVKHYNRHTALKELGKLLGAFK